MDAARQLQDSLGGRRFTGIDVGEYPNIAIQIKICHVLGLLKVERLAAD
jgi:hypothetical protein